MAAFGKRIFLFFIINILIITTISLVISILGIHPYLSTYGIDYLQLAIFCLIWGMGGAFISLLLSKVTAKWMMGVKVIDPNSPGELGELVRTVHKLAMAANLPAMPEVGIYDSPEVNAFATGPSKGNALVAVSSGLLQKMRKDQVEGVLGHEIAHIANGDMVTMTLLQGIVNAFVMFLARVLAFAVSQALAGRDREERSSSVNPFVNFLLVMIFQTILMFFGMIVIAYFSRKREFRADKGGAMLAGRDKMISALRALMGTTDYVETEHPSLTTLKISGRPSGFMLLFSTHPNLAERIQRLEIAR